MERKVTAEELEALREVEETLREFVAFYDEQTAAHEARRFPGTTHKMFASGTIEMVEKVRPKLAALDELRKVAA